MGVDNVVSADTKFGLSPEMDARFCVNCNCGCDSWALVLLFLFLCVCESEMKLFNESVDD